MIRFIFICSNFSFYSYFIRMHTSLLLSIAHYECVFRLMMCLFALVIIKLPIRSVVFHLLLIYENHIYLNGRINGQRFVYFHTKTIPNHSWWWFVVFIISIKKLISNHFKANGNMHLRWMRIPFKSNRSSIQLCFDSKCWHTPHHTTPHNIHIWYDTFFSLFTQFYSLLTLEQSPISWCHFFGFCFRIFGVSLVMSFYYHFGFSSLQFIPFVHHFSIHLLYLILVSLRYSRAHQTHCSNMLDYANHADVY